LDTQIRAVEKWNGKAGNVDPRLISEAYRLLLVQKKAPSNVVLVSGDKDYEPMLVDYEKQGRTVAVCFYPPVGGGAKNFERAVGVERPESGGSANLFGSLWR
jgi:hypothetical protein